MSWGEPLVHGTWAYGLTWLIVTKAVFTDGFSATCRVLFDVELRWFALAGPDQQKTSHILSSAVAVFTMAACVLVSFLVNGLVYGYADATALKHMLVGVVFLHHVRRGPSVWGVLHVAEVALCADGISVLARALLELRHLHRLLSRFISMHQTAVVGDTRVLAAVLSCRVELGRAGRDYPHVRKLILGALLVGYTFGIRSPITLYDAATVVWFAYRITAEPE